MEVLSGVVVDVLVVVFGRFCGGSWSGEARDRVGKSSVERMLHFMAKGRLGDDVE